VVAFILSGLVVMGVFVGLAGLIVPRLFFDPRASRKIARLEGLASWMEQLRDTMASGAGLQQVILVTSRSAPAPVATEVRRLALDLQNRVTARTALLRLAHALEDETGDLLVAGLMQAADLSGARLSEILTLLATSAREEVAMRQRVDAAQTKARNEAKSVVGLSGAMFLGLATFGRAYMAPYHTFQGAMVLTVVAAIYMSGVWLFTRLATPVTAPRLLADAHDQEPGT
jgi:Flp pilus assembly protein TadB